MDDYDYSENKNKPVKLYRKNEKDEVNLKEISRGMYSDNDSFEQALDFWYGEGYYDTYKEAQEGPSRMKKHTI